MGTRQHWQDELNRRNRKLRARERNGGHPIKEEEFFPSLDDFPVFLERRVSSFNFIPKEPAKPKSPFKLGKRPRVETNAPKAK